MGELDGGVARGEVGAAGAGVRERRGEGREVGRAGGEVGGAGVVEEGGGEVGGFGGFEEGVGGLGGLAGWWGGREGREGCTSRRRENGRQALNSGALRKLLRKSGQLDAVKFAPTLLSKGLGRAEVSWVLDALVVEDVEVDVLDGEMEVVRDREEVTGGEDALCRLSSSTWSRLRSSAEMAATSHAEGRTDGRGSVRIMPLAANSENSERKAAGELRRGSASEP